MFAARRPPRRNTLTLAHLRVHRDAQVWKSSSVRLDQLGKSTAPSHVLSVRWVVADVFVGHQLLQRSKPRTVPGVLDVVLYHLFGVFQLSHAGAPGYAESDSARADGLSMGTPMRLPYSVQLPS